MDKKIKSSDKIQNTILNVLITILSLSIIIIYIKSINYEKTIISNYSIMQQCNETSNNYTITYITPNNNLTEIDNVESLKINYNSNENTIEKHRILGDTDYSVIINTTASENGE